MILAQRGQFQEQTLRTKKLLIVGTILGGGFLLALLFSNKVKVKEISETELANAPASQQASVTELASRAPSVVVGLTSAEAAPKPMQITEEQSAPTTAVKAAAVEIDFPKFREMAREALKTLPKQVPIVGLTEEEAHHPTQQMLDALQPFIDIVQAVADNPKLEPAAFVFYKKCATEDSLNLSTTLRSRCLSHMRRLQDKLGKKSEVTQAMQRLNPAIIDLSNAID